MTESHSRPDESHSRQVILDRLRSHAVAPVPLPQIDPDLLIRFDDPVAQFTATAKSVGATVHRIGEPGEVVSRLEELESFRQARQTASLVPAAFTGNTSLAAMDDPHELKDLDWLVAQGEFGVAENGAIWIPAIDVPHRVSFFITQHLAIVLPTTAIVPHMHAAYERIGPGIAENFGVFVSGPSKTADIEQSLVLGAHGCRTLTIFLCDSP